MARAAGDARRSVDKGGRDRAVKVCDDDQAIHAAVRADTESVEGHARAGVGSEGTEGGAASNLRSLQRRMSSDSGEHTTPSSSRSCVAQRNSVTTAKPATEAATTVLEARVLIRSPNPR